MRINKMDLVEFSCEYVEEIALKKYGIEFDSLKADTQTELWNEAEQEFYEAKVSEADNYRDYLNEAENQENFCN